MDGTGFAGAGAIEETGLIDITGYEFLFSGR